MVAIAIPIDPDTSPGDSAAEPAAAAAETCRICWEERELLHPCTCRQGVCGACWGAEQMMLARRGPGPAPGLFAADPLTWTSEGIAGAQVLGCTICRTRLQPRHLHVAVMSLPLTDLRVPRTATRLQRVPPWVYFSALVLLNALTFACYATGDWLVYLLASGQTTVQLLSMWQGVFRYDDSLYWVYKSSALLAACLHIVIGRDEMFLRSMVYLAWVCCSFVLEVFFMCLRGQRMVAVWLLEPELILYWSLLHAHARPEPA